MSNEYFDDDDLYGKAYDPAIAGRLLSYLKPYKKQVIMGLIIVIIAGALQVAGPLIVRAAIDDQITKGKDDKLPLMVGAYLGILGVIFVLSFIQAVLMTYVGQRVMMDLRLQLFNHVQRMSMRFFDRNPVGRLVTRVTNDISTLDQVISQGVVETLTNIITLFVIAGVLLVLDWKLALIMLVLVPGLVWVVRYFAFAQREAFREQRAWLSRINSYLNEKVTGMTVVQLFNLQKRNFLRFDERNQGLLVSNLRVTFYYAVFEPTVVLFNALTTAIIIWYGGGRVLHDTLTLGTLVAFLQYMQRFFYPIRELSERYTTHPAGHGIDGAHLRHHGRAGRGAGRPRRPQPGEHPRPYRVPQRLVRLRPGQLGAARHLLHYRAGRESRYRRCYRRRQVDADEHPQPLLRCAAGRDPGRWRTDYPATAARATASGGPRAAGRLHLHRQRRREHPPARPVHPYRADACCRTHGRRRRLRSARCAMATGASWPNAAPTSRPARSS